MLWKAETDLLITEPARRRIESRLAEPSVYPRIAALLFGGDSNPKEMRWNVAYYDRHVVEGQNFDGLLIQASGLEFVLPQSNLLEVLSGMQLDWDGARFTVDRRETS